MSARTRAVLARAAAVALVLLAVLLLGVGSLAALERLQRELHERLPASTWLVVESVEARAARLAPEDPLVFRVRALRHRPFGERRTAVLSCRAATGMLAGLWRPVGPVQRLATQDVTPAVIGYAEEEPAPAALAGAERLPGLELWPGPLPGAGHECVLALRWVIVTGAGAEHVVTARSAPFEVAAPPPPVLAPSLVVEPPAEPAPAPAPAPPATTLLEEVHELPGGSPPGLGAPQTLEQTLTPPPAPDAELAP